MNEPTGTEAEVCKDIAKRQALGLKKYGVAVADNPLTHKQWLQHAYEEALDLAIYLKRAMSEPATATGVKPGCGTCDGSGAVDSGGADPQGHWLEVRCPECEAWEDEHAWEDSE